MIGLINLEVKCAGARSAGNPHAACDVEGAGNGVTERPIRARRGKPRIQTRSVLVGYRASSRPYQAVIDYLIEENRVFKEQLEGQRLRFTDAQRRRFAVKLRFLAVSYLRKSARL